MDSDLIDTGPRYSKRLTIHKNLVELVAGYDAVEDRWRFHAYFVDHQKLTKLATGGANTMEEAFHLAAAEAADQLDFLTPSPGSVRMP